MPEHDYLRDLEEEENERKLRAAFESGYAAAKAEPPTCRHRNGEYDQPEIAGYYWIERTNEVEGRRWAIDWCLGDGAWRHKAGQYAARFYGPIPKPQRGE